MDDEAQRAYLDGLKLLARRELSEAQLRARLTRRNFGRHQVDAAIAALRRERALDDRRAALACARTQTGLRRRGRVRVLREIEAMGIARDVARAAVAEVFAGLDEAALLEEALSRRLRNGASLSDPRGERRIHRYLVAQGFDPARVADLIESHITNRKSQME